MQKEILISIGTEFVHIHWAYIKTSYTKYRHRVDGPSSLIFDFKSNTTHEAYYINGKAITVYGLIYHLWRNDENKDTYNKNK